MIYVTGDVHGDYSRFKGRAIRKLRKNDTLIICGDFGFIWDGSKAESKILKKLGKKKYNIVFVEGENDNLNLLYNYPQEDWNGGKVRIISGRLRQLCRGNIFNIEDKKIFAFGGGEVVLDEETSVNKQWQDHIAAAPEDISLALKNLDIADNNVDYIITYQSTGMVKNMLTMKDNEPSVLDIFLDNIRSQLSYKKWFFGGFHINKLIPPKDVALFDNIVEISGEFDSILPKSKKKTRRL